jgi:hypothetical protein
MDPAVATTVDVHSLVTNMLNTYATTKQKEKYLKPLTFNSFGSFCLSEAGSGSDAFAMKTRAVLDGIHYILNGSKMWNTNSYEEEIQGSSQYYCFYYGNIIVFIITISLLRGKFIFKQSIIVP